MALRGAEEVWRNEFKLNKTKKRVKLDFFDYTRYDMANEFLNQFSRLNFLGVSVSAIKHTHTRIHESIHFYNIIFVCLFFCLGTSEI